MKYVMKASIGLSLLFVLGTIQLEQQTNTQSINDSTQQSHIILTGHGHHD